jgi:iron(III) transport system ATP-binding protein
LMFQDYALFPHLTVRENVAFGLRDLSGRDEETAVMRALSRVGMADEASNYPGTLSGGEQQRVALARVVAPRPGVVLMDEPFSNLDRRMRDAVREETIALLREMGATTVIVTHDPEEAMRIADRVALLRDGVMAQIGMAADLYRRPVDLSAARFFCDFTELDGIVRGGRVQTPLGLFDAPGLGEGVQAIACVRPEGIRLRAEGFCIPGRVLARRFLGEVDLLDIVVQGVDAPVRARLRGHAHAQPGVEVGIAVDPEEVLVFARPGA